MPSPRSTSEEAGGRNATSGHQKYSAENDDRAPRGLRGPPGSAAGRTRPQPVVVGLMVRGAPRKSSSPRDSTDEIEFRSAREALCGYSDAFGISGTSSGGRTNRDKPHALGHDRLRLRSMAIGRLAVGKSSSKDESFPDGAPDETDGRSTDERKPRLVDASSDRRVPPDESRHRRVTVDAVPPSHLSPVEESTHRSSSKDRFSSADSVRWEACVSGCESGLPLAARTTATFVTGGDGEWPEMAAAREPQIPFQDDETPRKGRRQKETAPESTESAANFIPSRSETLAETEDTAEATTRRVFVRQFFPRRRPNQAIQPMEDDPPAEFAHAQSLTSPGAMRVAGPDASPRSSFEQSNSSGSSDRAAPPLLVDAVLAEPEATSERNRNQNPVVTASLREDKKILGLSYRWAYICGGVLLLCFCSVLLAVFLTASKKNAPEAEEQPKDRYTDSPTNAPTAPPTKPVVFYATYGRFLAEHRRNLPALLNSLPSSDEEFIVHLGDWHTHLAWKRGDECDEEEYEDFAELMSHSSVPVFLVPGDNDYTECPDPAAAWAHWEEYLGGYDQRHWVAPSGYDVKRQTTRDENFSFIFRRILFIGLNTVGGDIDESNAAWHADERRSRFGDNLAWVDSNVNAHQAEADVLVIFSHTGTEDRQVVDFYSLLNEKIRDGYNLPTVIVRSKDQTAKAKFKGMLQENVEGIPGYTNIHVHGGYWPPMRIEIDSGDAGQCKVNQSTWYENLRDPGSKITFYATGGIFQGQDFQQAPSRLANLPSSNMEFLVHLGDWQEDLADECPRDDYVSFAALMSSSSVPVYLSPGDNEYNDCPDPDSAWVLWDRYLSGFDQLYWPKPTEYKVVRQPNRKENFAFVFRGVLFVGLNLVGGTIHNATEWSERLQDDLEWVNINVGKNESRVEVLVLFGNAGSENYRTVDFYYPLEQRIKDVDMIPTLVVRPKRSQYVGETDWDGVEDKIQDGIKGLTGYMNIHVERSVWPPTRIRIDSEVKTFYADEHWWQ